MAIAPQPGPPAVESTAHTDLSYTDLLRLERLRPAVRTDVDPSMAVFLVPHQVAEIWFDLMQKLLDHTGTALVARDSRTAADLVRPLPAVMGAVEQHFKVLRKLSVDQFEDVRGRLGTASGIQSAQWRLIEYTCGLRDQRHVHTAGFTAQQRAMLLHQLDQTPLEELFAGFAAELGETTEHGERVARIRADLLQLDEAVRRWRHAHVEIAKHFLGERKGTGGTNGVEYLQSAADRSLFPGLTTSSAGSPHALEAM
ncbi:tryptophan 2,3-dioxygenase family protein [Streptomyces sp. NPDC058595]|uniref:tryptophan 2,3-dioxygenase family protein n=1 Tax=Streptomyces sp. NPDC058595 TaxID=3346550 RepID=UPI00364C5832